MKPLVGDYHLSKGVDVAYRMPDFRKPFRPRLHTTVLFTVVIDCHSYHA